VDYVEPDVVLSKDNIPVIVHGVTIEEQTNVATLMPEKKRSDGHWYVIDLTLAELKQLSVHEVTEGTSGKPQFPGRFPLYQSSFQVTTLKEYLQLIKGLNQVTGKNVGIYLEPKQPEFHEQEGKDLLAITFKVLKEEGYDGQQGKMILQSFSSESLKRIKKEWNPKYPLVQLISFPEDKEMISPEGLKTIATYAQGIGPDIRWTFEGVNLQQ
jgi:glycerophosphoryl diester phosphodiesterase